MSINSYQTQLNTKNTNISIILKSLKDSPKRFSELKRITGFSDRGISKMLKGLQEERLIDHNPKNKQYYIANSGLKLLKSADISHITNRIRNDDGMYYPNYSDMSQVFLPQRATGAVRPFMYIDKNLDLLNLLSTSDVEDIETLMFKKLSNSIKRNRLIEENTGEIVLGFIIDYHNAEKILKKPKRSIIK